MSFVTDYILLLVSDKIHGKASVMNQYRLVSAAEKTRAGRSSSVLRQVSGC